MSTGSLNWCGYSFTMAFVKTFSNLDARGHSHCRICPWKLTRIICITIFKQNRFIYYFINLILFELQSYMYKLFLKCSRCVKLTNKDHNLRVRYTLFIHLSNWHLNFWRSKWHMWQQFFFYYFKACIRAVCKQN